MDNLTHTLTGMLLADLVCGQQSRARAWPGLRGCAFATSILANNAPDLDSAYAACLTHPRPLGALLHHRGHTHTVVLALPLGLAIGFALLRLFERRHGPADALARAAVLGLGLLGGALHLLLDYGNNYGVHPFWPWTARWFYGDAIFIVEPLWLAVLLPGLAWAVTARWLRISLLAGIALVLALELWLPFVGASTVVSTGLVAAVSCAWGGFAPARLRSGVLLALCAVVALTFATLSARAADAIRDALGSEAPRLRVRDIALSPMPGTPWCWNALVVAEQGSEYRALTARVAPLPGFRRADTCPYDSAARPTAALAQAPYRQRPELHWQSVYAARLEDLRALAHADCRFRAFLRFARVPYLSRAPLAAAPDGVAGDLRFDRSPGLDFSDMSLDPSQPCPELVPPWLPPRADVFDAQR